MVTRPSQIAPLSRQLYNLRAFDGDSPAQLVYIVEVSEQKH